MSEVMLRLADGRDVDAVNRHVQAGFDFYAAFAPPDWEAPRVAEETERTRERLDDPETWARLGLVEGAAVGHAAFFPAREQAPDPALDWRTRPLVPGLAHLWHLFVLEPWWGAGVAPALHAAAIAAMAQQGFRRARLYTPAAHARARRFYERRGWIAQADAFHDGLGLVLTEYARQLP